MHKACSMWDLGFVMSLWAMPGVRGKRQGVPKLEGFNQWRENKTLSNRSV